MLEGFHRAGADHRRSDEAQTNGLEFSRREMCRGIAGPERVAIAGHDRKAGDLCFTHEVVDLRSLRVSRTKIVAARHPVSVCGPGILHHSRGKVLQVHAVVESAVRISPYLPRRLRAPKLLLEPRFLLDAENGPRLLVLAGVRNARIAEFKFGRRLPSGICFTGVERDHRFLRKVAPERRVVDLSNLLGIARVLAAEAALVSDEEVEVLAV